MTVHRLKTWTAPFDALVHGRKLFEWRSEADREFVEGDLLCLEHYDEELEKHSGAFTFRLVTYVLRDAFGVPPGFAVMSLALVDQAPALGIEIDDLDRAVMNYYLAHSVNP